MHKRKLVGTLQDRSGQSYNGLLDDLGYHGACLAKYANGLHAVRLDRGANVNKHTLEFFEGMVQTHIEAIKEIEAALFAISDAAQKEGMA